MALRRLRGGLGSFVGVARFGLDERGVPRFGEPARIVKRLFGGSFGDRGGRIGTAREKRER